MTDCEQYQEWISAELDGELSAKETAELMKHLESCTDCREYREACTFLEGILEEPLEEPPKELLQKIMSTIGKQKQSKLQRTLLPLAGLAACIVIVIAAFPAITSGRKSTAMDSGSVTMMEGAAMEEAMDNEAAAPEAPMETFTAKSADIHYAMGDGSAEMAAADSAPAAEAEPNDRDMAYQYYTENYSSVLYLWPDCTGELESYGAESEEGYDGEEIYVVPDVELDDLLDFLGEDVQFTVYGGDADNGIMAVLVETE